MTLLLVEINGEGIWEKGEEIKELKRLKEM
jgi:hypothetical protein